MTVKPQVIQIATADGNDVVVASGLQPGMLVVSAGVHVLSPGQKVTIYRPSVPATTTSPVQTTPDSMAKPETAALASSASASAVK